MKLNFDKCKFMLFNPAKNSDFIPELEMEGKNNETVQNMNTLGIDCN